ncbi:MAG: hypothetical protein IT174_10785 [Acidobacteria bacterium]|nr:hypothetical protein [Acidobacteriota bacterium]
MNEVLKLAAINRHRRRLFGDVPLLAYTVTPEAGETLAATFLIDWFGQRIEKTTTGSAAEAGAWQFQVKAADDWANSQAFMLKIAALAIGARRWRATKVEKPIGVSMVWKIRATN